MNTTEENIPDDSGPTPQAAARPFGYWLTAVDRLMAAEFAGAFADDGLTRRDWRLLNRIDGSVADGRPVRGPRVRALAERGWVERTADGWSLTDSGRAVTDRLGAVVDDIRQRVAGALTPEEFATMSASLEKIARELGWQEGMRLPRRERPEGPRGGRRHGRRGSGRDRGHDRRDRGWDGEHGRHPWGRRPGFAGERCDEHGFPARVPGEHGHGFLGERRFAGRPFPDERDLGGDPSFPGPDRGFAGHPFRGSDRGFAGRPFRDRDRDERIPRGGRGERIHIHIHRH